jgi:hypothetical protein
LVTIVINSHLKFYVLFFIFSLQEFLIRIRTEGDGGDDGERKFSEPTRKALSAESRLSQGDLVAVNLNRTDDFYLGWAKGKAGGFPFGPRIGIGGSLFEKPIGAGQIGFLRARNLESPLDRR